MFGDVRGERGGVIGGERVRDMRSPVGGCRARLDVHSVVGGAHSADMTSLMAARSADCSTTFFAAV
jgi:hypothetical protein